MSEEVRLNRTDNSTKQAYVGTYSVIINFDNESLQLENRYIRELYFMEDVFTFAPTGKIAFVDNHGITERGPLTGNETVTIAYGEAKDNIEKTFTIYKMSDMSQQSFADPTTKNGVEFFFADDSLIHMNEREYSKSWSNTNAVDIISDISQNMVGLSEDRFASIEESDTSFETFCMPYWTPKEAITWLMKRMKSSTTQGGGYLFYGNTSNGDKMDGNTAFNLRTIESLIAQEDLMKIDNDDDGKYFFESNDPFLFNKVLSFKISGIDRTSVKGLRGRRAFGFDPMRKKLIDTGTQHTYASLGDRTTVLGERMLFPDISDANAVHTILGERDEDVVSTMCHDEWVKRYANQQTVTIDVRGHEGRHAGGLIELVWPSNFADEVYNKNFEGAYLIKSITHWFTTGTPNYIQRMVLIKNGFQHSSKPTLKAANRTNMMESSGNIVTIK